MPTQLNTIPYRLNEAAKLAETSPYGRFKLGAIIARKNKVLSMGTNSKKTHPLQEKFSYREHLNSWLHAEVAAISYARAGDLQGADIYVSRIISTGQHANSRPCPGCLKALQHFGIKRMFYYADGKYYRENVG